MIRLVAGLAVLAVASAATVDDGASGTCSGSCELHPALRARIQKDLAWLDEAGGITDAMIRNISLVCSQRVVHQCNVKATRMMIKDGEVYLNSLHPDWRLGPPEFIGFLLELYETSKLYRLPDLEFAWNGDDDASSPAFDWKDRAKRTSVFHGGPFPLLAWSKGEQSFAILVPYSGAFRCTDDSFDALLGRLEELRAVPWSRKAPVAFGRWNLFCAPYQEEMPPLPSGEAFECPRKWLPQLAERDPNLMDIAYLGPQPNGKPHVAPVPLAHQNVYKYIVSTDGWAISSKFDKYLLLGSTIFKAASSRSGYYYDALRPGEHFLPAMNSSKGDLLQMIEWAYEHDSEAARIAGAAQQFAVRHLHRAARTCYYRTLLGEMGRRMRYTPDCSHRQLCVPVGRFLHFLSTYPRTQHTCRYQEVLLRHGVNRTLPYGSVSDDQLLQMLRDDKHWPRDTDIPPLREEPYFPGA